MAKVEVIMQNVLFLLTQSGFAHGCKTAVLSGSDSSVLDSFTLYPRFKTSSLSPPEFSRLSNAVENFGIETIAIGNGTACRETEKLVAELIRTKFKVRRLSENQLSNFLKTVHPGYRA